MRDRKILTPHEAEIDRLIQIMAVLIDKLGGEVIINRHELEAFFDTPVTSRVLSKDYIRLRVACPEEVSMLEDLSAGDLPEETPQV